MTYSVEAANPNRYSRLGVFRGLGFGDVRHCGVTFYMFMGFYKPKEEAEIYMFDTYPNHGLVF